MFPTENPTEDLIRAAREKFNIAIAEKDIPTIRSLLAPSYHIVTGRSEQSYGADEEAVRWTRMFQTDSTRAYRRTPLDITINEEWGLAQELGNWKGTYTSNGTLVHISGVYAAKWQRATNGGWVIQAEMFTTVTCTGPDGGCIPPDPIRL
jgi:ketosteroid isomerase-like protein